MVKQQTATITLTDKYFNQHGLESSRPFVVHFSTDWSGSSDIMTCIIDDLALEYADQITFGKIDADEHSQIAVRFGIESVPTLLFFNNGRIIDQITGMVAKRELADKLKTLAP